MSTQGNAAGNTIDLLDLKGENLPPKPLPSGFTARGIVALVFSCVAGIVGVGVIAWYGLGEMGSIERQREEAKVNALSAQSGVDEGVGVSGASAGSGHGGNVMKSVLAK
jgi:iron transport multicopper oxidase